MSVFWHVGSPLICDSDIETAPFGNMFKARSCGVSSRPVVKKDGVPVEYSFGSLLFLTPSLED